MPTSFPGSKRCETCRYFRLHDGSDSKESGECRRYPPQYTSKATAALFPDVASDDWCGDYRMQAATANALHKQPGRPSKKIPMALKLARTFTREKPMNRTQLAQLFASELGVGQARAMVWVDQLLKAGELFVHPDGGLAAKQEKNSTAAPSAAVEEIVVE